MFARALAGLILMPAQREFPVDPAEAGSGRHEHMRVLAAEERMSILDALENLERSPGLHRGPSELLEPVMDPIEQVDLAIELVPSGGDHFVEPIPFAQFPKLGIIRGIELESPRVFVLHER